MWYYFVLPLTQWFVSFFLYCRLQEPTHSLEDKGQTGTIGVRRNRNNWAGIIYAFEDQSFNSKKSTGLIPIIR